MSTLQMTREQWLEERKTGIGGSDAPTIMGVNPWASKMDLWLDKTGQYSEDLDSEPAYWGTLLEDVVAREYAERTGKKLHRVNQILRHPEYDWMLANIDRRVVGEKAGAEIKTTNAFNKWPWHEGQVPPYYYAQVQHYLAVTGYELWYVAVLVGGQKLYSFEVYPSEDYINELIQAEADFWELVQTETPPELDGSEASTRIVSKLYPEAEKGTVIDLPDDAFDLIRQHDEAAQAEKEAKELKDEAANRLKNMIGDAEKGIIFDRTVSWTNVTSKRFDTKKFQGEQEELYKQYLNESTYRRFVIK